MLYGKKRVASTIIRYIILIAVGIIMVYPLLWMVSQLLNQIMKFLAELA